MAIFYMTGRQNEPEPASVEEPVEEPVEETVQEDMEEFENGDKVVMDATGETYIEPEYSPDLVEAAHQWANKGNRKFANDSDMVIEFMADDAYIDYIINGTIGQEEEPVQQQPTQQLQQQPQQQQGNQGQQQQQQPTQQPDTGVGKVGDKIVLPDGTVLEITGDNDGDVVHGEDMGNSGYWELPPNVHIE